MSKNISNFTILGKPDLNTQNGFAFLEALSDDVSVESLGRTFDQVSAHTAIKVRPSTDGSIPSALQLLPGQSFYIGKVTLSLVPEEHRDLPIPSPGLPDSNFESYNYQVSHITTPQGAARTGFAVMETPMPNRDHGFENSTPILDQITGQAIAGKEDGKKWPKSPLKHEVMRRIQDANKTSHSSSHSELKKEHEHMADAAIYEPSRSNPDPEVKTEDENMTNPTAAKPLGEGVVDLEDPEMAGLDLGREQLEKSEPLSLKSRVHQEVGHGGLGCSRIAEDSGPSPRVSVHPEEDSGTPSYSPYPAGLERLPSSVAHVQPKRRSGSPDQSPFPQVKSDSSPQLGDDLDDTPARKKVKITMVTHETLTEESQDSLQNQVISVKRGTATPTDRPVSIYQASSTFTTPSVNKESANQSMKLSPTHLVGSKRTSTTMGSDSRPQPANRPPSGLSFGSAGTRPQTPLRDWNIVSASPSKSVEPNSSMRSTRSTARDEHNNSSSTDTGARICFASSSSTGDSKPFLKFLLSKGVKKVKSVHDCTVLCVGKELKKTSKVILAVLLGKDIVTDSWVTDSVKGNDLLSLVPYMARDLKKEAEWGISLDEAIYRGKTGLKILQDHTVLFTPSVKKELGKNGFDELKEIVKCAGAKTISSALPKKSQEETTSTVVIGTYDSAEVAELQKLGLRAHVKDIISLSVLRGKLDLESDEFFINEKKKESRKRKR